MIDKLNHVAIAVSDLESAASRYRNSLGAVVSEPQHLPEHGVSVVFVELPGTRIELLAPLGGSSPISGFLNKNPSGGLHHVCLEVPDIEAARDRLISQGHTVLGEGKVKRGAHGKPVLFIHPVEFDGTLIELEEA